MLKLYKYYQRFGIIFSYRFLLYHIKHFLGIPLLFISTWHTCNANCNHCFEKFVYKSNTSLTTKEVKNIIDQFYSLNEILIYLCSGEFLMHPDAIELISYARNKKIVVSVVTPGLLLSDDYLEKLKQVDLNRLIVSIDSANSFVHDKNRGTVGIFERATKVLEKATKRGNCTQLWTYVSCSNYNELDEIIERSKKISKKPVFVFFPLLSEHFFNMPKKNLTYEKCEFFRKKYNPIKEVLFEFPYEHLVCRGVGNEHNNIVLKGEVTFCPPVPYSYGNALNEPLNKILSRIKAHYLRFFKKRFTGQCLVNFIEYRENKKGRLIYG